MRFTESLGSFFAKRKRSGGARPLLRTFVEICNDLNVSQASMRAFIKNHNGPQPKLDFRKRGAVLRSCWYDFDEFRKWWEKVKP